MKHKLPLITWDARFNTGVSAIDAQHKELVELLNCFATSIENGETSSTAIFDSFNRALRGHFAFEENTLHKMGTPQDIINTHAVHHAESLQLLEELAAQLTLDPHENASAVLAEVSHCLLVDLLDEDRYCFVTTATQGEEKTSLPISPALQTFKRMVKLLNENNERVTEARDYYLTLLKDFPVPLLRADSTGHFDWFNNTWRQLTGINSEVTPADDWANALHPDDRGPFVSGWEKSIAARIPFLIDYRLFDVSGELRWIHHLAHPFFDAQGVLLGYLCILFDITERKKSEERLSVAATLFEHATDAIMVTNAAGIIEAINPAFSLMTGYGKEKSIGRSANLLRSGFHPSEFYRQIWQQVQVKGIWEGEIVNRRANGELFPVWLSITTICGEDGSIVRMVGVFNEVRSKQSSRKQLMHMAHHDALTGLPNRLLFTARAQHSLERCAREKSRLAILFIDLDKFKPINDQLGHLAGDRVLAEIAASLGNVLRNEDTVARFGGDEFVVLVERSEDMEDAKRVAQKLLDIFPIVVREDGIELEVSASIGISLFPDDGQSVDDLLEAADRAMYKIKQSAR